MKYFVAISTDNKKTWASNLMTFDTPEAGEAYASNLMDRWFAVTDYRILDADKYKITNYQIEVLWVLF